MIQNTHSALTTTTNTIQIILMILKYISMSRAPRYSHRTIISQLTTMPPIQSIITTIRATRFSNIRRIHNPIKTKTIHRTGSRTNNHTITILIGSTSPTRQMRPFQIQIVIPLTLRKLRDSKGTRHKSNTIQLVQLPHCLTTNNILHTHIRYANRHIRQHPRLRSTIRAHTNLPNQYILRIRRPRANKLRISRNIHNTSRQRIYIPRIKSPRRGPHIRAQHGLRKRNKRTIHQLTLTSSTYRHTSSASFPAVTSTNLASVQRLRQANFPIHTPTTPTTTFTITPSNHSIKKYGWPLTTMQLIKSGLVLPLRSEGVI
ncbi:hypothetical protein [Human circovirus VS6600022]|uniref:Uncharacterized protein n=1 Tax=Human circovirus VS6600022 TaxID=1525173 RepID=A0A0A0Q886_9VIRU|nr:hypothetical protein [Human circovirus VS6600022]AIG71984.1 hypothetical protein [Human circovirus VS6600022]